MLWGRTTKSIAEPLIEFWAELRDTIHPQDYAVLNEYPHSLNTDYPPPAFVGDVRRARVFVLLANGGYDAERTPQEFARLGSAEAYRDRLRNPVPCDSNTHPYYLEGTRLREWLQEGRAAVVNAMAYRSRRISEEPQNRVIAEKLRSVQFHRRWLREYLIPAAEKGEMMVIAHRPGLWRLDPKVDEKDFFLFTGSSKYKHLPNRVTERAEEFLKACLPGDREPGSQWETSALWPRWLHRGFRW